MCRTKQGNKTAYVRECVTQRGAPVDDRKDGERVQGPRYLMKSVPVSWALRQQTETPLEKLVLSLIAEQAGSFSTQISYPMAQLTEDARCSRSGAHKALRGLASQGLIQTARKTGWRTLYKLNPPLRVVST